jgi:hypothetical protein
MPTSRPLRTELALLLGGALLRFSTQPRSAGPPLPRSGSVDTRVAGISRDVPAWLGVGC